MKSQLYQRPNSSVYWVDFRIKGRRVRRSTGTSDKREAGARAEEIFCEEMNRSPEALEENILTLGKLYSAWAVEKE